MLAWRSCPVAASRSSGRAQLQCRNAAYRPLKCSISDVVASYTHDLKALPHSTLTITVTGVNMTHRGGATIPAPRCALTRLAGNDADIVTRQARLYAAPPSPVHAQRRRSYASMRPAAYLTSHRVPAVFVLPPPFTDERAVRTQHADDTLPRNDARSSRPHAAIEYVNVAENVPRAPHHNVNAGDVATAR